MENAIQVFSFSNAQVRVINRSGDPWWVAKDVCEILGLSNNRDAIGSLDEDEKGVAIIDTLGGKQEMATVSEAGLYSLILRSRKPEAKSFKRWITHEVIPTIRKHGGYLTPAKLEEVLLHPDTLIKLAQNLKDEQIKRAALEAKVAEDAPKVTFADAVLGSETDILVRDMAKILCQNGIVIGQNRLFKKLISEGYLIRQGKNIMPAQRYVEQKLFKVYESTHSKPDGSMFLSFTTKVTPKGQQYFINKFLNGGLKVA